jgi:hypothetical protein
LKYTPIFPQLAFATLGCPARRGVPVLAIHNQRSRPVRGRRSRANPRFLPVVARGLSQMIDLPVILRNRERHLAQIFLNYFELLQNMPLMKHDPSIRRISP